MFIELCGENEKFPININTRYLYRVCFRVCEITSNLGVLLVVAVYFGVLLVVAVYFGVWCNIFCDFFYDLNRHSINT